MEEDRIANSILEKLQRQNQPAKMVNFKRMQDNATELVKNPVAKKIIRKWKNEIDDTPIEVPEEQTELQGIKKILFWNSLDGHADFQFGLGGAPFGEWQCPEARCHTFSDRGARPPEGWDAIVWNLADADHTLPAGVHRTPHTMLTMYMEDSPHSVPFNVEPFNGVFNWTFTFREDSDFFTPSGLFVPLYEWDWLPNEKLNNAEGKHGFLAVTFIDECKTNSGRERLVRTMQKYVQVDVFGNCGTLQCPHEDIRKCFGMVEDMYKFYLAFEDSLCRDFLSEQIFIAFEFNLIPVLYGWYNEALGLPPHSYINVLDFESVGKLVDYLKYLNTNDTAYSEYFKWKGKYGVYSRAQHKGSMFCNLCKKLHEEFPETEPGLKSRKQVKVYADLQRWWVADASCIDPQEDMRLYLFIRGFNKKDMEFQKIPKKTDRFIDSPATNRKPVDSIL